MDEIYSIDDFHTHLRQGSISVAVTKSLAETSGISIAFVMPNTTPPIKTTEQAIEYKKSLQVHAPNVQFLMSLYLSDELTVEEVKKAKSSGVVFGIKSYPKGVTTNSDAGIESYEKYYPIFQAMSDVGLILNLHGEVPSSAENDVCVLNAESKFLHHLEKIHLAFPKLKIVLEHASSKDAVEMVKRLGDTVGCTITIHHLELVVDDWAGACHCFCKPVAKFPSDRQALRDVILEGHPRFFLGTDSAPHPKSAKESAKSAAGVYTGAYAIQYLAHALESFGALDKLESFACINGRKFYGIPLRQQSDNGKKKLIRKKLKIDEVFAFGNSGESIVPYKAATTLDWSYE